MTGKACLFNLIQGITAQSILHVRVRFYIAS